MELKISETQVRELFKEVLVELMEERRELFFDIVIDAIEEAGLANAIREGRQDEFVDEDQVLGILRGRA